MKHRDPFVATHKKPPPPCTACAGVIDHVIRDLEWPDDLNLATLVLGDRLASSVHARVEWTSSLAQFRDDPVGYEARAKVTLEGGSVLADVVGCGATPEEAHANATFMALRLAKVGDRAVCGEILRTERARAILAPTHDPEEYHLRIDVPSSPIPRRLRSGRAAHMAWVSFTLRVRLDKASPKGRTRYLRVVGLHLHPALKDRLRPFLAVDGVPVRLHRLILALFGMDLRDGGTHVHHINGAGPDCRRENLEALPSGGHRWHHRRWISDLNDPGACEYIDGDDRNPYMAAAHGGQSRLLAGSTPSGCRHTSNHAESSPLAPISALRRDRRRSLDRTVIALLGAGNTMWVADLVHALSESSCSSMSGIRKVIKDAEAKGTMKCEMRGQRLHVSLTWTPSRVFRIRRRSMSREMAIRRLRLRSKLRASCKWFQDPVRPSDLARSLRRVVFPKKAMRNGMPVSRAAYSQSIQDAASGSICAPRDPVGNGADKAAENGAVSCPLSPPKDQ